MNVCEQIAPFTVHRVTQREQVWNVFEQIVLLILRKLTSSKCKRILLDTTPVSGLASGTTEIANKDDP